VIFYLERRYIQRRLAEEERALMALMSETFPLTIGASREMLQVLALRGREMPNDVYDFLERGHQKVIDHYNRLLSSPGLSDAERRVIVENQAKQRDFRALVGVSRTYN
jgi:ribose 1,5-bisphosphokinase PhnN